MTKPFTSTLIATLVLALSLAACGSGGSHESTTTQATSPAPAQEPTPAPTPASYDDAAADAACNACTATGGNWAPMQTLCIHPGDDTSLLLADAPSFGVCPGACADSNCGGCVTQDSCEAAGCTFTSSGPAYSCH